MYDYPSMLELNLTYIKQRGPRWKLDHTPMKIDRFLAIDLFSSSILFQTNRLLSCKSWSAYNLGRCLQSWLSHYTGALQWRLNGRVSVSIHQPHHCLLNRLFRRRSKKTPKLRVTGLCARNSPVTGEFQSQMASNAENASIGWRLHVAQEINQAW